jgi:hypothetical protein
MLLLWNCSCSFFIFAIGVENLIVRNVLLPCVRTEKHLHMKTINIKIQFNNMFIKCCHVWFQIKLLYQLNSVLANILFCFSNIPLILCKVL